MIPEISLPLDSTITMSLKTGLKNLLFMIEFLNL